MAEGKTLPSTWNNSFRRAVDGLVERGHLRLDRKPLENLEECVSHYPGKTLKGDAYSLRLALLPVLLEWTKEKDGLRPKYGTAENEVHHFKFLKKRNGRLIEELRSKWNPIENRLRSIHGHLDFRFMMDDSRIFIANLNKGALGEDKSSLLGSLIIYSYSETEGSMLRPILGREVSSVQFRSLDEQLHSAMAKLFEQEERRGFARIAGMKAPVSIMTPTVTDIPMAEARVAEYTAKLLAKWEFALPAPKAADELTKREKSMEQLLRYPKASEEPEDYRRRVDP